MKSICRHVLGIILAVATSGATARAQEDGREVLRQSLDAMRQAPAYRATVVDAGGSSAELSMEVVNPNLLHLRTGMGTEIYADGKTILSREGASGSFTPARGNVAATVALARQMATPDALLAMATGVRPAGRGTAGGQPASLYDVDALVFGMRVKARVWVADADRRPLRVEGEVDGEAKLGGSRPGRRIHRSSVVTYEYDPSIKVIMPAN